MTAERRAVLGARAQPSPRIIFAYLGLVDYLPLDPYYHRLHRDVHL